MIGLYEVNSKRIKEKRDARNLIFGKLAQFLMSFCFESIIKRYEVDIPYMDLQTKHFLHNLIPNNYSLTLIEYWNA